MKKFYPVSCPVLNGNEKEYVLDSLDTTWISSSGKYIAELEKQFAEFCNTDYAVSCMNGTAALHLALMAHGVKEGDEVIVPTLTYVATANAVTYCGAKPVFVDSEPETWNIDPNRIEERITHRTKGIIVVHLYGHPADMDPILKIAKKYGLFVIEDAAEAFGAKYKGKMVGSIGHSAIFSLYGNKVITTGEGGIVTTKDEKVAEKAKLYRGQGMDPTRRYWFPVIGYNYRMTNLQAAIGCAQIERADWHIQQRIRIAMMYTSHLKKCEHIILPVQKHWARNVYWLFSVLLKDITHEQRDWIMKQLYLEGIETRPFFYPMHVLPAYSRLQADDEFPVANRICAQGINLPSYGGLQEEDILYISETLKNFL